MKNKRFKIVIFTILIITFSVPIYVLFGIAEVIITAVITAISIVSGTYLGGQSISDVAKYYKEK